jgi:hypothetical protein
MPGEYAGSVGDFHIPKRYFLILFMKVSVKRLLWWNDFIPEPDCSFLKFLALI